MSDPIAHEDSDDLEPSTAEKEQAQRAALDAALAVIQQIEFDADLEPRAVAGIVLDAMKAASAAAPNSRFDIDTAHIVATAMYIRVAGGPDVFDEPTSPYSVAGAALLGLAQAFVVDSMLSAASYAAEDYGLECAGCHADDALQLLREPKVL